LADDPVAYFITLRTYETWLSGDGRGSVDDEHHVYGEPFAPRDDFRAAYQARRLKAPPFLIEPAQRRIIEGAVLELCEHRGWELLAVNVRTNHVHVVLVAEMPPERAIGDLKAFSTRALRRAGAVGASRPVWAGHGSTKYVWDEEQLERCMAYTLDEQGNDLPGSAWVGERRRQLAARDIPPGPDGTGY
jgi:REP element-mobilizing transposase RayT